MNKREFIQKCLSVIGTCYIPYSSLSFNNSNINALKEADFYTEITGGIQCHICPKECTITNGDIADCHNRINKKGKFYSTAYGNPCSVHLDPIEKLPLYHFLPSSYSLSLGLAGCNLTCLNCQNWKMSQFSPNETQNFDYIPEKVIEEAINNECNSIAFTYTEPVTFYEFTFDTLKLAKENNIKTIVKTAGYINEEPLRKLCSVVDGFNVDLKSFNNNIYIKLNGGTLNPVLNTLKVIKEEKSWLEITNLIIPDWTDDLEMIKKMCGWLVENGFAQNPIHFGRFFPDHKLMDLPPTPLKKLFDAVDIAKKEGVQHVYLSGIPGNENSVTRCRSCSKALITRQGYNITKNMMTNDECSFCKSKLNGVWS